MKSQSALLATVALCVTASCGCTYATLEVSHVPNPVLLGPVDRIGGHRAGDAKTVSSLDAEVSDFATATNKSTTVGNTVVTWQETKGVSVQAARVTKDVLGQTEGRADRDVRIERIPVGAWLFFAGGTAMADRWVGLHGQVVEVRHGR